MEENVIKFTDDELNSIKEIQAKYQQKLIRFGQLALDRMTIEESISRLNEAEKTAKEEYLALQKQEDALVKALSDKYGEGTLQLSTGTFVPNPPKT